MLRPSMHVLRLPAFASAHSHAFQRGLRGRAQRPRAGAAEDFWSWRAAMYDLALSLDPDRIAAISGHAFRELRAAGVRTVGEFHYVHHQAGGTPYAERTLLADRVIEAALGAGLRVCLLRVAYARAGHEGTLAPAQLRFCDARVDEVLRDVDTLRARWGAHPDVRIGIAPHSVRAVPPSWLRPLAEHARRHGLPLHMHVAEQPAEIEACVAETGRRPVELLDEHGLLDARFVAVHATHLAPHEATLLGRSMVCVCPTTERDLGDGLPNVIALRAAGARLCVGVDSHVVCDPVEEMRALETGERLRTLGRLVADAETLVREATTNGAVACGFGDAGGEMEIDLDDPSFAFVPEDLRLEAFVMSAPARVVRPV